MVGTVSLNGVMPHNPVYYVQRPRQVQTVSLTPAISNEARLPRFSGSGMRTLRSLAMVGALLLPVIAWSPATQAQPTRTEASAKPTLGKADVARYQAFADKFDEIERLTLSQDQLNKVNALWPQWSALVQSARDGNKTDRLIMEALHVHMMKKELISPNYDAFRPDYNSFMDWGNKGRNGEWSAEKFKTEIRWRALKGLYSYYGEKGVENPLLAPAHELYDPIAAALKESAHEDIQRYGASLLNTLYPHFTAEQQKKMLKQAIYVYQGNVEESKKLAALRNISMMYATDWKKTEWDSLKTDVKANLKAQQTRTDGRAALEQKYDLIMLGILAHPGMADDIKPYVDSKYAKETQMAAAWALGRELSPASYDLVTSIVDNEKFNVQAREMAVFSAGEFAGKAKVVGLKEKALKFIEGRKTQVLGGDKADSSEADVKEAARVTWDLLHDRLDQPEFFINKFIKEEADKKAYRELRAQYVAGWENLDVPRQNMVDRALIPYRDLLKTIVANKGKHTILTGFYTEMPAYKEDMGKRHFDGRLNDTIKGISSTQGGAMTHYDRIYPGWYNTFMHEFTHHMHQWVMNKESGVPDKIKRMYDKAVKEGRVMNYYGTYNEYEYLAECGEAMERPYSAHWYMQDSVFNNGYNTGWGSIRGKLKRLDPDAYEFFRKLRSIPLEISMRLLEQYDSKGYAYFNTLYKRRIEPLDAIV